MTLYLSKLSEGNMRKAAAIRMGDYKLMLGSWYGSMVLNIEYCGVMPSAYLFRVLLLQLRVFPKGVRIPGAI